MWRVRQSQPDRLACVDLQISGFRRIAHSDVRERIITLARPSRASKNISRDVSYQRRYHCRPLSCVATFFSAKPQARVCKHINTRSPPARSDVRAHNFRRAQKKDEKNRSDADQY